MPTEGSWTLCSGFAVTSEEYVFPNDATHEDSAEAYAAVKVLGQSDY